MKSSVVPTTEEQRYEIGETLGAGSMGAVIRARDTVLDREVAIKTLLEELQDDPRALERFHKEARAVGRMQHPNIPPVHEYSTDEEGRPYFSMRLVTGETLRAVIDRLRRADKDTHAEFSFERRVQIGQQICDALQYAHSQGIIHRDLKPDNVMVGRFGEVSVMDWGLACNYSEREGDSVRTTVAGTFCGTPAYAAPEQIAGKPDDLGPRTDIYGIGALLYELCTLELPHSGTTTGQVLGSVLTKKPKKPELYNQPIQGRVPRELSLLIMEAMEFDAEDRIPTAFEFKRKLQLVLQGESVSVCPHTFFKRNLTRLGKFLDNHHSAPLVLGAYLYVISPIILLAILLYQNLT